MNENILNLGGEIVIKLLLLSVMQVSRHFDRKLNAIHRTSWMSLRFIEQNSLFRFKGKISPINHKMNHNNFVQRILI